MNSIGGEKRLFARKQFRTKVVFEDEYGEGLISLFAEDLSLGGLFITGNIPIKTGSYVFVSFLIPGYSKKIRATGQIVRVVRKSDDLKTVIREGLGIRFVGLSKEAIDLIQEFVS